MPGGTRSRRPPPSSRPGRGGRNLAATAVAVFLALCGTTVIAVAVAAQERPPQPPPSAAMPSARPSPEPVPDPVEPPLPSSEPVAVDVPAIQVHSPLQHLGLTPEHTLQVPVPGPRYDEAAWYENSSTPGTVGPAVLLGHVDSLSGGPSVFFNLGKLRPGDEVLVTRADGLVAVFRVDGVRRYAKDDFPTQLVYGATDHAALRLITCGGDVDRATRHYRENIVVFASLVGSHEASRTPRDA